MSLLGIESDSFIQVRSIISIVPQTPDLFEGTLRDNIDPVGEYTDSDIWAALEQVPLFFQSFLHFGIMDYDILNRVVKHTDALGSITKYSY